MDHDGRKPVHCMAVVDCLNATYTSFLFELMSTVQLSDSKEYDTHILMHSTTSTADVSLVREFKKHLSNTACKYGAINEEKNKKQSSKLKFTERDYHVQDNDDVAHKYFKIFCDTTQFPPFAIFWPTQKNHMVSVCRFRVIIC